MRTILFGVTIIGFMLKYLYKQAFFIMGLMSICLTCMAQSIYPSIINISGQSKDFEQYRFEWSVGESTAVNTMFNNELIVTNGFLQDYAEAQPAINSFITLLPEDIKFFPNPVENILKINILHRMVGKNLMQLTNLIGKIVLEKEFEYSGHSTIEPWDISSLISGLYILNIQQISSETGSVFKKGSFKIMKL